MPQFQELQLVQILKSFPNQRVFKGMKGTVVHVHSDGRAYEVEIPFKGGTKPVRELVTCFPEDLMEVQQ